tara:strand:+ start:331 stop:498 length:168 start_codon:yes stop_codon:yes gene_type:complete
MDPSDIPKKLRLPRESIFHHTLFKVLEISAKTNGTVNNEINGNNNVLFFMLERII